VKFGTGKKNLLRNRCNLGGLGEEKEKNGVRAGEEEWL
jgi:hypothetical protein